MKKNKFARLILTIASVLNIVSSNALIAQDQFNLNNASIISYSDYTKLPNFIKLNSQQHISPANFSDWMKQSFNLNAAVNFKSYSTEKDKLGFTHIRFKQYIHQYPIDGTMLIAHMKEGHIISVNGDFYQQIQPTTSIVISEQKALQSALQKVNAKKYKWENTAETELMKVAMNNPSFSYLPKGELVVVHKSGNDYSSSSIKLAYKFNIYAEQPLSRAYIYVDAQSGEVIAQQQILHTADVVGTANTKYSGTVSITTDNYGTNQYRLRETGRGNGIQTYNMNNSPGYFPYVDFTNTSSTWNLSATDKAATDAHWGAEQTYDYYSQIHSRNSIDGNGYNLLSFVHYDVNVSNAFWDGIRMTYGDGDPGNGFTEMTGLDICGHEITHGLVSHTAGLSGGGYGEPDAINEAWSDIMGTNIERFARPSQWDWILGADVTVGGTGLRTMSDPHLSATPQPDTYLGQYWSTGLPNPHINDGPAIYWYYLLCQGGSGTNDLNNTYTITGISIAKAQMIAYRALTVYATPSTNYANMRLCTIQAANDLFGACSNEAIQTANAWYAVGVGTLFSSFVSSAFNANITSICSVPYTVYFNNTSANTTTALWNFGDGNTSTQINPSHTYTAAGAYTVTLTAGGGCGSDVLTKTSYINISPPASPTTTGASSCQPSSLTLSAAGAASLNWYTAQTGGTSINTGTNYTTPLLTATTTYYVESSVAGPSGTAGPVNNNFGSQGTPNIGNVRYQTFNVIKPCTLVSVLVYANGAGNRTITMWDKMGNIVNTWSLYLPNGQSTMLLNQSLIPGNAYRLGGIGLNLNWNNSGANYPYNYTGYLNITGNNSSSNSYLFFYNWQIKAAPCVSARTPVVAAIGPNVPVTYSAAAYDTVCSYTSAFSLTGGSPAGGTYSGTGVSGGMFDPAVSGMGNFIITYSFTDINNCIGTATQAINVNDCVGINKYDLQTAVMLYPNPSNGNITMEIESAKEENASIQVMNTLGQNVFSQNQKLLSGNNKIAFNLTSIAKGMYFLQIKTATDIATKRIDIQ